MYDLCGMKVVLTSATDKEIIQIKQAIDGSLTPDSAISLSFHESHVGILASCFSITKLIFQQKPDLIIQAGIAGSFIEEYSPGKVVIVKDEMLADTGVEENGNFKDIFDLNLHDESSFPFTKRKLLNTFLPGLNYTALDEVTGITINEITTRRERIEELKAKYNPVIESMEGASLHYCCLKTSTPFIQIRAISNYVGERDKAKWKLNDAIENLTIAVRKYIDQINRKQKNLEG